MHAAPIQGNSRASMQHQGNLNGRLDFFQRGKVKAAFSRGENVDVPHGHAQRVNLRGMTKARAASGSVGSASVPPDASARCPTCASTVTPLA